MEQYHTNRIQCVDKDSVKIVRSSQVIGSLSRAVEELARNAVLHGRATQVVFRVGGPSANPQKEGMGTSYLEVCDNGIGIDPDSLERFVGRDNCSSTIYTDDRISANKLAASEGKMHPSHIYKDEKVAENHGESLKALASLCIQMSIECNTLTPNKTNSTSTFSHTEVANNSVSYSNLICSKKAFYNGQTISFSSTPMNSAPSIFNSKSSNFGYKDRLNIENKKHPFTKLNSVSKTGSAIKMEGLFQRHAVRRRHHIRERKRENKSRFKQTSASIFESSYFEKKNDLFSEHADIAQVQNIVTFLALSFPFVTFMIENGRTGTVVAKWACHNLSKIKSHHAHDDDDHFVFALKARLFQMSGESISIDSMTAIIHNNSKPVIMKSSPPKRRKTCSSPYFDRTYNECNRSPSSSSDQWRLVGILGYRSKMESKVRAKENCLIFVNERRLNDSSPFASKIRNIILSHAKRNDASGEMDLHCIFHFRCLSDDVQIIVDESWTSIKILQKERFQNFLLDAIKNMNLIFLTPEPCKKQKKYQYLSRQQTSFAKNSVDLNQLIFGNKRKSGTVISTNVDKKIDPIRNEYNCCGGEAYSNKEKRKEAFQLLESSQKSSPFTNAFFSNLKSISEIKTEANSKISFDDTFLQGNESKQLLVQQESVALWRDPNSSLSNVSWTKKRIQPNEKQIMNVDKTRLNELRTKSISLTKEMIANATVISQVAAKFIIINAGGILCVVDQHAADERISLEKLETRILKKIRNDSSNAVTDCDSKFLRSVPLVPPQLIHVTSSQIDLICKHEGLLQDWKFTFQVPSRKKYTVLLSGVPEVLGKVASTRDFVDYILSLSGRTNDAAVTKPDFVKRVLASHACRYAIMFGDMLPKQRCIQVINELAKCKLSFVCAHGRPSIVPLLDMSGLD